jgi:O-antigen/teichoic acid export membrane protein
MDPADRKRRCERGRAGPPIRIMTAHVSEPASEPTPDVLDSGQAGGLVMRGAVLRVAGFAVGSVLTAGSIILLTRHLGVARFGQYATLIALGTLVAQFAEGGLTNLATRDFALADREGKTKLLSDRLGLQIFTTILATAICGVFAVLAGYGATRTWAALAAGLGLGLAALQLTVAVPLVTSLRLGLTSGLELARQTLLVALTVTLVLLGAGLLPFLVALIPSSLAVLVATWVLVRPEIALRPRFDPSAWAALVRPALVLSLSSGIATLYVFTAQILTSLSTSPFQTGLFAASLRVFMVIASVPGMMVAAALPLLARAARDDAGRLEFALDRLFIVAMIAGVGIGVILVTGAGPIIDLIAGRRYAGAVAPLRIEGAAVLGTCLTPVWSTGLLALHKHGAMLRANLAGLTVVTALTLSLAPAMGATGAAIATVAGEWTVALALMLALVRGGPRPRRPTLLVAARVALAGGVAMAALLITVPSVVQLIVAGAIYLGLILGMRALPRELLELIPRRFAALSGR